MSSRPSVSFQPPLIDQVTTALVFVDRFSLAPVRQGVKAWLWDPAADRPLSPRLIRNLSGNLVLINQPEDADYTFRVDPADAGYLQPPNVSVHPSTDGIRRVVWLDRRPDAAFDDQTTLVRGAVVRTAVDGSLAEPAPVVDVTVSVVPAPTRPVRYRTQSDERGVFALALRLPPPGAGELPAAVTTTLRFEKAGAPARELARDLTDGRSHVFVEAIDLDGTNQPHIQS